MKSYSNFKNDKSNTRAILANLGFPMLLLLLVLFCLCLSVPKGSFFGSEGDWFCQHVPVAEQYRQAFYETGKLFPDYLPLGGGSNSYDFSYYGFLRPDVLISYLLPDIPMAYIISCYAILELVAGAVLCYFWLKRHVCFPLIAFLGATLYSCASCFYHAHRQIMFVNYMPFLILALWGIESLIKTGKIRLLTISLFLVYMHSFYFAPAVLSVCGVYFVSLLANQIRDSAARWPNVGRFAMSIGLSIGMAAILLLPTGLDLLSTTKDAGTPPTLQKIFSFSPGFNGLLYQPYSCGLTILCLYTLLLSIRRKSTRILSIFLFLCLTINTFPYLLSGLLYVRYKVLIPLVPLLLLLCVKTLESLFMGKEKHSLLLGAGCLIPAAFSRYSKGILIDCLWMLASYLVIAFLKRYLLRIHLVHSKQEQTPSLQKALPLCLILCVPAVCLSVCMGQKEEYISVSDNRQASFQQEDLSGIDLDQDYRFECLTEPYANTNTQPLPGIGRTSMYSSVTDCHYANFYYNTMKNPIRVRNRVALLTDGNPFFSYLMGIRYISANLDCLPLGYAPLREQKDSTVLAENTNVLPITYTSTSQMSQNEFEKLSFPYTLEALTRYTIVEDLEDRNAITAQAFLKTSQITPVSNQEFHLETPVNRNINPEKEVQLTIPVPKTIKSQLLILSADVVSPNQKEVTIDMNQIRNKLSGKNASYPNHNDTFTWILSSNDIIETLEITLSAGDYHLSNWQIWSMETKDWGNDSVIPLEKSESNPASSKGLVSDHPLHTQGSLLVHGRVTLEESGSLVTSLPYRQGYKAYVNGEEIDVSTVNQTFVGIPLEAGKYEISIFYTPPGKIISIWISLASLLFFLIWELLHLPKLRKRTDGHTTA